MLDSTKQKDVVDFLKTVFNDFDYRCVAFMGPLGIILTAAESIPTIPPESSARDQLNGSSAPVIFTVNNKQ